MCARRAVKFALGGGGQLVRGAGTRPDGGDGGARSRSHLQQLKESVDNYLLLLAQVGCFPRPHAGSPWKTRRSREGRRGISRSRSYTYGVGGKTSTVLPGERRTTELSLHIWRRYSESRLKQKNHMHLSEIFQGSRANNPAPDMEPRRMKGGKGKQETVASGTPTLSQ